MNRGTSPQIKMIVFAIALLLITPLFVFFVPLFYSQTVYIHVDHIALLIPMRNFVLVGVGFACLIVMLLLLAWKRQLATYMLGGLLVVGAIIAFLQSQTSYIVIQESGIETKMYSDVKNYYWEEMTDIVYDVYATDANTYTFTMNDGETVEIVENGQLQQIRGTFLSIARQYNINYIENHHD
ncbi:hypothetical protein [Lysinibacillus sp. LZ02]|uniref:hypothetical protein n=1 Tax=Lysinibacillus sp. LZ02 TaxID=3420668 RepID=UPI003D36C64D